MNIGPGMRIPSALHGAYRVGRTLSGALAVLVVTACGSPTDVGSTDLVVEPTEETFVRSPEGVARVGFSVTNRGTATIGVSGCSDWVMVALDRDEEGGWVHHLGTICPAVFGMSPLPIEPGETLDGGVEVAVREPGRYRLRIDVHRSSGGSGQWQTTSPAFTVE